MCACARAAAKVTGAAIIGIGQIDIIRVTVLIGIRAHINDVITRTTIEGKAMADDATALAGDDDMIAVITGQPPFWSPGLECSFSG